MVSDIDARAAARLVLDWRAAPWPKEFWITASVLGGRRYSRFDVEDAVGPILGAKLELAYRSQRERPTREIQPLAFRLTVDQRRTALLVRLADLPLHRRFYWRQTRPGALYPPLAAAMALLGLGLILFMFTLMARVSNPMMPRALFGILNVVTFFPSGALYPTESYPRWLQVLSMIFPMRYAVHALRALLLKGVGPQAVALDFAVMGGFALIMLLLAATFFKRTL